MFFSADDDDQDFMSGGGGSKLANLFGMDKASGQGGNASLTYTAPKEPKKKEHNPQQQQGGTPSVVVACVVQAYKYVDNKYASQGKLGAALLANHSSKDYRILLYVSKQQQVTNAKISTAFSFNIQENNYASFYDDARQTWSLLFDSAENIKKFAKEIAIAKANSADALTDVIKQDLALGEGGPLEHGDSVEVKYTGWLLTNCALSQSPFDSNTASDKLFRFKVGKGKVIKGWDQGMLGMKKGGTRTLVIPSSLGYGEKGVADRIPANSTLVFEVEVVRVKLAKGDSSQESPASAPITTPAPAPSPSEVPALPTEQDDLDDPGIKGRTRSISEQLSQSPNSDKAKLISRMARMGQPMLPFQGAVPAQPDEDDAELQQQQMEYQQQQQTHNPHPKPVIPTKPAGLADMTQTHAHVMAQPGVTMVGTQPVIVGEPAMAATAPQPVQTHFQQQQPFQPQQQQPAFLQNLPGAQQLSVYQNPNSVLQQQQQAVLLQQQQQQQLLQQQQAQMMGGISQSLPTQIPLQTDSLAPVLLTETRQQNTEVRMSISKMAEKVDKILDKVEHMNPGMMGAGMPGMGVMSPYTGAMPAPTMEANVLMQNITRIVQDNERLKKEVYEQSSKVQEQNDKINTLLEKNQKYVEQSQNLLEQRNEGYKTSANQSQARVLALEQEKVSLATELSTASAQITTLQLELGEFRKREGELKQKLQMTSSTGTEAKEELERLKLLKEENEQKIATLATTIREEKQARKQVESKLTHQQDELIDLKSTNETLEKNLTERKKKAAEERRKLEEDLEDSKINYETTIDSLREKLRRQKSSTDAETENKVSKLEEEISKDWQRKSEQKLVAANEKHQRQLDEVKEEKEELSRKVEELQRKLVSVRSSGSSTEQQITDLKDELEETKAWKGKYENLRKQASAMKEKYEKRIEELETEKEEEEEKMREVEEKSREQRQQLLQQMQQLRSQQTTSSTPVQSSSPTADVATEVKKIMNKVFQTFRGEFEAEELYQGSQVLASILNVIKKTTLELVSNTSTKNEVDDEGEEEEEDEEEEEEDEEEEEAKENKEKGVPEVVQKQEKERQPTTDHKPSIEEPESHVKLSEDVEQLSEASEIMLETPSQKPSNNAHPQPSLDQSKPLSSPISETTHPEEVTAPQAPELSKSKPISREENSQEPPPENVSEHEGSIHEKSETEVNDDLSRKESIVEDEEDPVPVIESEEKDIPETKPESPPAVLNGLNENSNNANVIEDDEEDEMHAPPKEKNDVSASTPTNVPENSSKKEKVTESSADTSSREPPPLFDDDEDDDDDSSLFGKDSNLSDTFGPAFDSKPRSKSSLSSNETNSNERTQTTPVKKVDLTLDEDNKPQPPPPLFGDDSDDDDLDWLS